MTEWIQWNIYSILNNPRLFTGTYIIKILNNKNRFRENDKFAYKITN